jgi:Ca2+-binding RTX toxin-like protein
MRHLSGGSGCDDFVFAAENDWDNDVIADYGCGDEIKLSGYDSSDLCYVTTSQGVMLVFSDGNTLLLNGISQIASCAMSISISSE